MKPHDPGPFGLWVWLYPNGKRLIVCGGHADAERSAKKRGRCKEVNFRKVRPCVSL